jgi:hypothetical protein
MAEDALFQGLVVYIVAYNDVECSQTAALLAKLQQRGATVSKRFSERVTHVVVQRTHATSDADRQDGDARLREIFQRIHQVCPTHPRPVVAAAAELLNTSTEMLPIQMRARALLDTTAACLSTFERIMHSPTASKQSPCKTVLLTRLQCSWVPHCNTQSREVVQVVNALWVHQCLEQGRRILVSNGWTLSSAAFLHPRPDRSCDTVQTLQTLKLSSFDMFEVTTTHRRQSL